MLKGREGGIALWVNQGCVSTRYGLGGGIGRMKSGGRSCDLCRSVNTGFVVRWRCVFSGSGGWIVEGTEVC